MKKLFVIFILLISCSSSLSQDLKEDNFDQLTFQNLNGEYVTENLSDKNTIIVFWADY